MLPQRERYGVASAGAIALLVSRLAGPDDVVIGSPVSGQVLPGGRFVPIRRRAWPDFGLTPATRYAAAVARTLRALPRPPGLVEVHNRPEIARALRRRIGTARLALFLHNDPLSMRRARSPRQRARLLQAMAVVCVSRWLRGRLLDGLDAAATVHAAVSVLPNCLDLSELPAALPMQRRQRTLLFVGRTVADKGADVFVAACAQVLPLLPGWRAAMLGTDGFGTDAPPTPFTAWLGPAAASAGVELLGYRPHAQVLELLGRSAVVAVPSRWPEPFGLTALEAMACGAALVTTGTGGLPEVVGAAGPDEPGGPAALVVAPGDAPALAAALRRLATDDGLRARLQVAGLARARMFDRVHARAALARLRASGYASLNS